MTLMEVKTFAELNYVWPLLVPSIERGLRHGQGHTTSVDELLQAVSSQRSQLWVIGSEGGIKGGMIFSVQATNPPHLFVEMLAGVDMPDWLPDLQAALIDFAQLVGAARIDASCRLGLARYLKHNAGWRNTASIMSLEI